MDCFREFTRLEIETDLFNPRQRPEVRAAAAQALGGIGAEAVWVLAGALGDREVGALSAEQLVKIGKPALPALLVAVQDVSNQRFQHRAAEAIGKIGAAEAVPTLQKVLKTDDSSASAAAARALGEIKHQSAAAALIDGLAFDDIQETVTTALESMGEIAVPALIEAAKDEGRNPRTRALAIRVLGSIPSRVGNQDIINALDSTNSEIRGEAFRAIGRRKAPEALPALIKALEHDTDKIVRYLAATALGTIGDPRAIPALENRLGGRLSFIVSGPETDQDVRRAIGAALEKLNAS
jgi:HEAT repeat protein